MFRRCLSASMFLSPSPLKEITSSLPFLHPQTAALSSFFRYLHLNFCKPLAFLFLGCFAGPSPLSSPLHLSPSLRPLLRAIIFISLSPTIKHRSSPFSGCKYIYQLCCWISSLNQLRKRAPHRLLRIANTCRYWMCRSHARRRG